MSTAKDRAPRPFWIAPAHEPKNGYAAGYDDNAFRTEREALDAIRALKSLGGEWDCEWIVNVSNEYCAKCGTYALDNDGEPQCSCLRLPGDEG